MFSAFVKDGDQITIGAESKQLTLHVNEHGVARRLDAWQQPALRYPAGCWRMRQIG